MNIYKLWDSRKGKITLKEAEDCLSGAIQKLDQTVIGKSIKFPIFAENCRWGKVNSHRRCAYGGEDNPCSEALCPVLK